MKDLSELQNYLEFIYNNIDDETERVEMSVDVFEDLRAFFNSAVLMVFNVLEAQKSVSLAMLVSLAINLIFVFIFIFKI